MVMGKGKINDNEKFASSCKKRAVRMMVTHGARFSVYQIMFGSQKCEL
jgi:hypothetical protein